MRSILAIWLLLGGMLRAADPQQSELDATIVRGVDFLARVAITWKAEHQCASCHHAALVVCAFREALAGGQAVDTALLDELTRWMADSGDGRFNGAPRPADRPKALNYKALFFSLALAANPAPDTVDDAGTQLLRKTVIEDQTEDGSWSTWPETRPPIMSTSVETATSLAVLALVPAAAAGDPAAIAARDRGVAWLAANPTDDDLQSLALRVILWNKLGRPIGESRPWIDRIISRQRPDGGWSQTLEMTSDAWATGQALYALACGGLGPTEPVIKNGQNFLIRTQREDGSWPMSSRPIQPGGEGSRNLTPITGAGSAWAVMGLLRSRR